MTFRVGQYVLLHTTKVPQGLSPNLTALGKVLSICVDLVQQTSTCTKCADVPQQSTQVFYSCEQNQTLQRPRSSSKFGPTPSRWTNLLCLGPAIYIHSWCRVNNMVSAVQKNHKDTVALTDYYTARFTLWNINLHCWNNLLWANKWISLS